MPSTAVRPTTERRAYRHEALLYSGDDGFLEGVLPFLRDGVAAGEPTMVVVSAERIALLRDALGQEADGIEFADMAQVGANPGRIMGLCQDFLDAHRGAPAVRGVGEPIHPGREGADLVECQRHEALLNLAFGDALGFWLVCPYDVDALDPDVIEQARCTHPVVAHDGRSSASDRFPGSDAFAEPFDEPLAEPERVDVEFAFEAEGLAALRAVVADRATSFGLAEERVHDTVLAVAELAANSIRHGGGSGVLRLWTEGATLLCEVRDRGRMRDPLAGRLRPGDAETGGRGLFIANQLCDLVQVRTFAHAGVVRAHVRR